MAKDEPPTKSGTASATSRNNIERYTQFLRAKSTIHEQQVLELNRILKRV